MIAPCSIAKNLKHSCPAVLSGSQLKRHRSRLPSRKHAAREGAPSVPRMCTSTVPASYLSRAERAVTVHGPQQVWVTRSEQVVRAAGAGRKISVCVGRWRRGHPSGHIRHHGSTRRHPRISVLGMYQRCASLVVHRDHFSLTRLTRLRCVHAIYLARNVLIALEDLPLDVWPSSASWQSSAADRSASGTHPWKARPLQQSAAALHATRCRSVPGMQGLDLCELKSSSA